MAAVGLRRFGAGLLWYLEWMKYNLTSLSNDKLEHIFFFFWKFVYTQLSLSSCSLKRSNFLTYLYKHTYIHNCQNCGVLFSHRPCCVYCCVCTSSETYSLKSTLNGSLKSLTIFWHKSTERKKFFLFCFVEDVMSDLSWSLQTHYLLDHSDFNVSYCTT